MSPASTLQRQQDPLWWCLEYWLDMIAIGIMHHEDIWLLLLKVDMEINKISDRELQLQFQTGWGPFQRENFEECMRQWRRKTLESREAQPYLRDLDRMMVDKWQKTREDLLREEEWMSHDLKSPNVKRTDEFLAVAGVSCRDLWREERADAKVRLSKKNRAHHH